MSSVRSFRALLARMLGPRALQPSRSSKKKCCLRLEELENRFAPASLTVQFAAPSETVNENAGSFSIAVNLSAASTSAVSVPFTLGGTAANGTNYSSVSASPLVIQAGKTTGAITGTLLDDGKFDTANKTLTVTLGAPTGATLGSATSNTLTIKETDPAPTVSFATGSQTVAENAGSFSVIVNLSAASKVDTTVPFSISGTGKAGKLYKNVTTSPLVIPAGMTSGTITGALINDNRFDFKNKTIVFTLGTPTNGTLGNTTVDTLTVREVLPKPVIANVTRLEGKGNGLTPIKIQVSLPQAPRQTVTYDVFTTDGTAKAGTNYIGIAAGVSNPHSAGTLTFHPGQTTATITVYLMSGTIPVTKNGNKTFMVSLSDPNDPATALATATVTIIPQ